MLKNNHYTVEATVWLVIFLFHRMQKKLYCLPASFEKRIVTVEACADFNDEEKYCISIDL